MGCGIKIAKRAARVAVGVRGRYVWGVRGRKIKDEETTGKVELENVEVILRAKRGCLERYKVSVTVV
jgi:hypothetical protein